MQKPVLSVTDGPPMTLSLIILKPCSRKCCIWSFNYFNIFVKSTSFLIISTVCYCSSFNNKNGLWLNRKCSNFFVWFCLVLFFLLISSDLIHFSELFQIIIDFLFKLCEMNLLKTHLVIKTNLIVIFLSNWNFFFTMSRIIKLTGLFRSQWYIW